MHTTVRVELFTVVLVTQCLLLYWSHSVYCCTGHTVFTVVLVTQVKASRLSKKWNNLREITEW